MSTRTTGDVWVFCECGEDGQLLAVSLELLGAARTLAAKQGGGTAAVLLGGATVRSAATQAVAFGADRVFLVTGPALERFSDTVFIVFAGYLLQLFQMFETWAHYYLGLYTRFFQKPHRFY